MIGRTKQVLVDTFFKLKQEALKAALTFKDEWQTALFDDPVRTAQ
jgi:hypothetical protein